MNERVDQLEKLIVYKDKLISECKLELEKSKKHIEQYKEEREIMKLKLIKI